MAVDLGKEAEHSQIPDHPLLSPRCPMLLDREKSDRIRFVSHPWFDLPDALERIENLKPQEKADEIIPEGIAGSSAIGRLCEQPVLSREEERYLFLRMNYEKFAAENGRGKQRTEHLSRATGFRNRLLMGNLRLLVSIAGQFASGALRTEDLVSEGIVPLLNAIELFDVFRGWAFGTYATHVLRNHFRRSGERRQRKDRQRARLNGAQLAEVPDEAIPVDCQEELARRNNDLAETCLAELSAVDQMILRMRFGFDDPASRLRSFAEVGEAVGLSKERVRVRTHRALEQLRETAQNRRWEYPELDALNLPA
jgi:RNA polymerase primary sigma factor